MSFFTRRPTSKPAHAFFLAASIPEPARSSDTAITGVGIQLGSRGWQDLGDGYSYVLPVADDGREPARGLTAESIADDLAELLPAGTRYTVTAAVHGQPFRTSGEWIAPTGGGPQGRGPDIVEPRAAQGFAAQVEQKAHTPPPLSIAAHNAEGTS